MQHVIHYNVLFGVLVKRKLIRKFQLELDVLLTARIHVRTVAMMKHRIHCVVVAFIKAERR